MSLEHVTVDGKERAVKIFLHGLVAWAGASFPMNGVDGFAQFNGNGAVFQDNVQSYSTVEPAIDLTASSFRCGSDPGPS
jgi:hypothetical protein